MDMCVALVANCSSTAPCELCYYFDKERACCCWSAIQGSGPRTVLSNPGLLNFGKFTDMPYNTYAPPRPCVPVFCAILTQ